MKIQINSIDFKSESQRIVSTRLLTKVAGGKSPRPTQRYITKISDPNNDTKKIFKKKFSTFSQITERTNE